MQDVRLLAEGTEKNQRPPAGKGERFQGYGVMAAPFRSGRLLAMRRFAASSIGAGYTSVWYRSPEGRWIFWSDQPPLQACPRYFGKALAEAVQTKISLVWDGPASFQMEVPSVGLTWSIHLGETAATRGLSRLGGLMPDDWWRSPAVLRAMSAAAGRLLRAGRLGLHGTAPNGQRFVANPMQLWLVDRSVASMAGEPFGELGPLPEQVRLGDFWIPQRGLFALGRAYFERTDPQRHLVLASAAAPA